jgi:exodeoxyribonuclease VII large subunit
MKTPTAVAEFLISGALQFSQELNELEKHFAELITGQLDDQKERLNEAADQLNLLVNRLIVSQQNRLNIAGIQLANRTDSFLKGQQSDLKQLTIDTKNKTNRFVTLQNHLLDQSGSKLNFIFRNQMLKRQSQLHQFRNMVKLLSLETLRAEKKNLNSVQEKLRLVDPQNILKRGFSLTKLNGKIVKTVGQLQKGDLLEIRLSDGTVESTVKRISNNK